MHRSWIAGIVMVAAFMGAQPASQAADVPLMAYVATPDNPFLFVFAGLDPKLVELTAMGNADITNEVEIGGVATRGLVTCSSESVPCTGFITHAV